MFKLQNILRHRLLQIGLTEEDILTQINEYKDEARDYLSLVLPDIIINESQKKILIDTYIQYKLFSMIEMDGIVEDKKEHLDMLVEKILENEKDKRRRQKELKELEKDNKLNTKRIMVF